MSSSSILFKDHLNTWSSYVILLTCIITSRLTSDEFNTDEVCSNDNDMCQLWILKVQDTLAFNVYIGDLYSDRISCIDEYRYEIRAIYLLFLLSCWPYVVLVLDGCWVKQDKAERCGRYAKWMLGGAELDMRCWYASKKLVLVKSWCW